MSLEKLTTRQLKQLKDNLNDCYNIVRFALSQREFDNGNINSFYEKKNVIEDCKVNSSAYFKFQYTWFQLELNYTKHNYYIVFSGFKLEEIKEFFNFVEKKSIYKFNDLVFDKLGNYSLYIPRDNANSNYFEYSKSIFIEFVGFFCSVFFQFDNYLHDDFKVVKNVLC